MTPGQWCPGDTCSQQGVSAHTGSTPHHQRRRSTNRERRLHSRHRPGHDIQPGHRLRPLRVDRLHRPARARADLPPGRLGRARPEGDLGQHPRGDRPGPLEGQHHPPQHHGDRHHQPARDRGRLGQEHRRARLQRDRLAGHPHPGDRRPASRPTAASSASRTIVGLPLATYFAGTKIVWILENVEGAREKAEAGDLLFGTTDTWVLWNLTGGVDGGVHVTDVTNASRTLFMDLETLEWRDDILDVVRRAARRCCPRSEVVVRGLRHASSSSPAARGARSPASWATSRPRRSVRPRSTRASRRTPTAPATSCIFNTGEEIVQLENGLLTTVGYKLGDGPTHYALEGSIAVTGLAHPVAARQPRHHQLGPRGRGARHDGRRQRRRVLRARVLRPVRARTGARTPAARSSA